MKKIVLLVSAISVFQVAGFGQEGQDTKSTDSRNSLHAGVKVGLNSSNVYNEKGDDFVADPKFGFTAGVFAAFPIGKYLGFQPEVQFNQKGYSASGSSEQGNFSYSRNTGHIDVPLQLQVKPFRFMSLVAGPQFSFMVFRQDIFHSGSVTTIQQEEIRNADLRRNTLGAVGGIDIYFLRRMMVSGRVGWDLQHNNGDGTSMSPRYTNTWVQGTVGLRF